jgi:TetR/AcrR family transcriptional regulator
VPVRTGAAARRAQILGCARAVFAECGYDAARMAQVADRAAVSERLVYKHFSGKRELFLAVAEEVARRVALSYRQLQDSGLGLAAAVNQMYELRFAAPGAPGAHTPLFYSRTHGPFTDEEMNLAMAQAYRTMAQAGTEFFAAFAARGALRPDADPEAVAWTLASVFREYESIRLSHHPDTAVALGRRIVTQLTAGIAA